MLEKKEGVKEPLCDICLTEDKTDQNKTVYITFMPVAELSEGRTKKI